MTEGQLPQASMEGPAVLTPEGMAALEERIFSSVTAKLEAAMDEAIKVAREETAEQFREAAAEALDAARKDHLADIQQIESAYKHGLDQIEGEATRRMAHATEQVKQAVKDGAELEKRINDLRNRLFEIAAEAEEQARTQIATAVTEVAATAEKYRIHVDSAGEFLTRVKNQILTLAEEIKPIQAFMASCEANGVSPSSLHALMSQVGKLTAANGASNGHHTKPWEKRDRRDRRGA